MSIKVSKSIKYEKKKQKKYKKYQNHQMYPEQWRESVGEGSRRYAKIRCRELKRSKKAQNKKCPFLVRFPQSVCQLYRRSNLIIFNFDFNHFSPQNVSIFHRIRPLNQLRFSCQFPVGIPVSVRFPVWLPVERN